MSSLAITFVLNGVLLGTVVAARIDRGRVIAPLVPLVECIASRVQWFPSRATVKIERDGLSVLLPIALVERGIAYVAVRRLVESFDGNIAFDSPNKTLFISLPTGGAIRTPAPPDPNAARVGPTASATLFPFPDRSRDRTIDVPRPRRTAIPATPSQPAFTDP